MQDAPDAAARAQLLADAVRGGCEAILFLSGNTEANLDEQLSAGRVRSEADAHNDRVKARQPTAPTNGRLPGASAAEPPAPPTREQVSAAVVQAARKALHGSTRRPASRYY